MVAVAVAVAVAMEIFASFGIDPWLHQTSECLVHLLPGKACGSPAGKSQASPVIVPGSLQD